MIKKVISIATILLVILGVGIVFTKASPLVGQRKVEERRLEVAGDNVGGLVVLDTHPGLVEEMDRLVEVDPDQLVGLDLQDVRTLKKEVDNDVSSEALNRHVGDEADTVHVVVTDNRHDLLDVQHPDDFYLDNPRNLLVGMAHHKKDSYLAVYDLHVRLARQQDNVLSGVRPDNLADALVSETVDVLKELTVDADLATLALPLSDVPSLKLLPRGDVDEANLPALEDASDVLEQLG